jgi:hypothetical protein
MNRNFRLFCLFMPVAALLLACSPLVSAQSAGFDLLQTGSGASVDLSGVSGLSPSVVSLKGVAIQSSTGNSDTIMHRTQNVPTGGGSVPVNVNALFMKNSGSETLNGRAIDIYVSINNSGGAISTSVLPQPDSLSGSNGTVTVRTDGTFDSSITVNADIIFVPAGASPTNPSNYIGHQAAPAISLSSSNSTWSSTAPAGYPSSPNYPSGGFYPKPVHNGPHPVVPAACPSPSPTPSPSPNPSPSPRPLGSAKTGQAAIAVTTCAVAAQ